MVGHVVQKNREQIIMKTKYSGKQKVICLKAASNMDSFIMEVSKKLLSGQ